MNRSQLIEKIMQDFELSKTDANLAVEAVLTTVMRAVAEGQTVSIARFGTFQFAFAKGRLAHNPRTGEEVRTQDRHLPRFKAGPVFAAAVRDRNAEVTLKKQYSPRSKES